MISDSIAKLNVCRLTCIMRKSTLNIALIAKLNVRQFALHSNSPNLMLAKCTMYVVCRV